MYKRRVFFEFEMPDPYRGISVLYELHIDDAGFPFYDVHVAHGTSIDWIRFSYEFPLSVNDALNDNLCWVQATADYINKKG